MSFNFPVPVLFAAGMVGLSLMLLWWAVAGRRKASAAASDNLRRGGGTDLHQLVLSRPAGDRAVKPLVAALARKAVRLTPVGWMRSLERRVVLAGEPARWPMERVLAAKFVLGAAGLAAGFFYFSGHRSLVGLLIADRRGCPWVLCPRPAPLQPGAEASDGNPGRTGRHHRPDHGERRGGSRVRSGAVPCRQDRDRPAGRGVDPDLAGDAGGVPRDQALRNLVDRTDVADLRHFVFALLQAQKHGVSVSQVLRVQTAELAGEAAAASRGEGDEDPGEDPLPAGDLHLPGHLHRPAGSGRHPDHAQPIWGVLRMTTQTTTLDLPLNGNFGVPKNLVSLLDDLDSDRRRGTAERPRFATGFDPMDRVLDGGLRPGDLTLIGGLPGVGKTITALQWARSFALAGHPVVYACYEHEERELLGRLLALEIAEEGEDEDARFKFRRVLREVLSGRAWLEQEVLYEPRLRPAYERLSSYADRLWVIKASGSTTGVSELARHVEQSGDGAQVLVVDYLQKVAADPDLANEAIG